jgi:hypothetical protein
MTMKRTFLRYATRLSFTTAFLATWMFSGAALSQTEKKKESDQEEQDLRMVVEQLQGEVKELREETAGFKEKVEMLEEAEFQDLSEESSQERLSVYGFFDFTFGWIMPYKDSFFDGLLNDNPSFMVNGLNIYLYSQISKSLSVVAELRFTFDPLGQETGLEVSGFEQEYPYERVETEVQNQFDEEIVQLGGVMIERVHLTWQPKEWFGVIAGRYITPCGIWNVDHGSPVLVTIRDPFMHTRQYIPLNQMGIQLFGRIIPKTHHYIDWAFTVSNGRGPVDTLVDFDKNKGLGLRLGYTYETADYKFRFGGYGYMGDYTDHKKVLKTTEPFNVDTVTTEAYSETVGQVDALFEFYNIQLQGEFMRGLIRYDDKHRVIRSQSRGLGFQPDYVYTDFYVMLAYTLPLDKWLGSMKLTPYFLYEYSDIDDSVKEPLISHILIGGLNFKPSPYVVLKLEYTHKMTPAWDNHGADFRVLAAQLAVLF